MNYYALCTNGIKQYFKIKIKNEIKPILEKKNKYPNWYLSIDTNNILICNSMTPFYIYGEKKPSFIIDENNKIIWTVFNSVSAENKNEILNKFLKNQVK